MGLKADLETRVETIFSEGWTRRDGKVVPVDTDLKLLNDAVDLDATILYADLRESTALVDGYKDWFAGEVYKAYLYCAARVVASEAGVVTAYDGDRIMAVFLGDSKNTSAVRAGMKISWALEEIVRKKKNARYVDNSYLIRHTVGIAKSKVMAARTGARGANDLVWVGSAANHAAKLTELDEFLIYITDAIFNNMNDALKYSNGIDMWNMRTWTTMNNQRIYGTTYRWTID